jgi:hypothetical protein
MSGFYRITGFGSPYSFSLFGCTPRAWVAAGMEDMVTRMRERGVKRVGRISIK